jgi:hypothetical protein
MSVVRELLSPEEIEVAETPSDSPGMAMVETTVEFLDAVISSSRYALG